MKCILTDVAADKQCAFCNKKTDCVQASIEGTFFRQCFLCWKCFRKAVELRKRQPAPIWSKSPQANKHLEWFLLDYVYSSAVLVEQKRQSD